MIKKEFVVEIVLKASPELIFSRLSTYTGLAEWFADYVTNDGNIFTFRWKDAEQKAELLFKKEPKTIRFRWLDDDCDDCYFEFNIEVDDKRLNYIIEINTFNMEARYPDEKLEFYEKCTEEFTKNKMNEISGIIKWLKEKL